MQQKLSEKALQVKLTIRRATLVKRNNVLTSQVQRDNNDTGLTVLTKLFRDPKSPIAEIMTAVNNAYVYHRKHTLPYQDGGYRLLPAQTYMQYTDDMRHLTAVVETLLRQHMPDYDALVARDVQRRNFGQTMSLASAADYPTADQFRDSTSLQFQFSPLPDEAHPLFDLSDEDRATYAEHVHAVEAAAKNDVIQRMLEPLQHLTKKIADYRGEKGERFHVANLDNVLEGCKLARRLAIDPTAELLGTIDELEGLVQSYAFGVVQLKESPDVREEAKQRLATLDAKLAEYFA